MRAMRAGDTQTVSRLIGRAMNPEEGHQAERTFGFHFACQQAGIDDGRGYTLLLAPHGIIGIAGLHHYAWGPRENVWLAWLAVEPAWQRQGLGTILMREVVAGAGLAGYRKLFVETYAGPDFAQARVFYHALGFTESGRIAGYLPTDEDMIVFGKLI